MSNKVNVVIGVDERTVPAGGTAGQVLIKNSDNDYDMTWGDSSGSGGSGSITPAQGPSPHDVAGGITGSNDNYAREDHAHELNVDDTILPDVGNGIIGAAGTSDYYSRADHRHQSDDYRVNGFILSVANNIFDSVNDLPAAGTAGRIAFVKIS